MRLDTHTIVNSVGEWLVRRGVTLANIALLVPILGIVLSETLFFAGYTTSALRSHFITLLYAVIVPMWFVDETEAYAGLALVSALRCVSLGMPVFFEITLYWLPLVYAPFLPGLFVLKRSDVFVDIPLDIKTGLLSLPVAVPVGFVLAEIEYRVLSPETLLPAWSPLFLGILVVVAVFVVALAEEFIFRGVLQRGLSERYGWLPGVFLASFVFAMTRSGYGFVPELIVAFGIGVLLGIGYELTDSLLFVTFVHGSLNVVLFGVLPLFGPFLL